MAVVSKRAVFSLVLGASLGLASCGPARVSEVESPQAPTAGELVQTATPGASQPTQTLEARATPAASPTSHLLCAVLNAPDPEWITCRSTQYGFEVGYPREGRISADSGMQARIDLPLAPGTNLAEKYLEMSVVRDSQTCPSPFTEGFEPGTIAAEPVEINGNEFTREAGGGFATGNFYDWIAYSTSKNGVCVSLGFVLHSTNRGAYATPPAEFDRDAEADVFEEIMGSFGWIE